MGSCELASLSLEGEVLELNSKGRPQGESDFLWGTTVLVYADFLDKENGGEWSLTSEGEEASGMDLPELGRSLKNRERAFQ